ncbi:hypothetical protein GCM10011328_15960 [Hafnia psychrotolerans]|jgi:hypothetical protein|uniref:Uncharacterized protein n=1 Tax=Hafnia psychrotolerans TaxID=1477018 RepID=A0ABQ1GDS7_9GAMM|nr:hypothetical protein GCM10011328_15960 [Hafnia psychrotolerans]
MVHRVDEPFKHTTIQGYQFAETPAMETCPITDPMDGSFTADKLS